MCKFYEYSVPEVEVLNLSHRVTAIHRYEFGFHSLLHIRPWIVISLKLTTELVICSGKCVEYEIVKSI